MSERNNNEMKNEIRPYVVFDEDGGHKEFEVSHKGLESAIEYAHGIGSAVVREDVNGGDEIVASWNPFEKSAADWTGELTI